ncbi:2-phosphosulfolactate phosphatase [Pimelobacter simplex]|uniref:Probable 2-phosphosulfolactate phosphatase n=1 Tax=Nocardioides simplex TaxID=2045 RepID=A0A0C5XLT3_NOCSI|nr:2-phosphosulfolactate phosphatase [Pimelobacter simplex]AJR18392.1 putative lipoprotein [Pimelobacter simplex]MCG8149730.1 2-phosphosulfolactate phosphatase [Pimelobacter simplex]
MSEPAPASDAEGVAAARALAHALAHAQAGRQVRLEWGPTGGAAISADADIAVVVDVLSFTTTLTIATARGTRVHPFAWKDERAAAYARERDAVLAVGRFEARGGGRGGAAPPSLSPAQLLDAVPVPRLVLPSPNGSSICAALAGAGTRTGLGLQVVGASLRNRTAVARWLAPRIAAGARVALVPAGERWPDGSLRPAVEDLWGAGAILDGLATEGADPDAGRWSAEARQARAAYRAAAAMGAGLEAALLDCASGRELVAVGFRADVLAAAALDADDVVPLLGGDGFTAA